MGYLLATCKECLDDFSTDELIWGDKGAGYWVCTSCYVPSSVVYCGDCLAPINECNHGKEN